MVSMVKFAMIDGLDIVLVLLWKDFPVVDGLYSVMVVILVDFFIDGRINFFPLGGIDCLMLHTWCDFIMDCGIMLA